MTAEKPALHIRPFRSWPECQLCGLTVDKESGGYVALDVSKSAGVKTAHVRCWNEWRANGPVQPELGL